MLYEVQLLRILNGQNTVVVILVAGDVLIDEEGLQRGLTRTGAACDTNGCMVAQAQGKEVQHFRCGSFRIDEHLTGNAGLVLFTNRGRHAAIHRDQRRNVGGDTGTGADEAVHMGSLGIQKLSTHTHHALDDIQSGVTGRESGIVVEVFHSGGTLDFNKVEGVDVDLLHGRVLQIPGQYAQSCHVLIDTLHHGISVVV